jgi:3-oxoacyl-[acyl-carrier protein] reductase
VALVTGGSRGIGRAVSLRLAGAGARVVVNYAKRADAADEVVAAIGRAGGEAAAIGGDVADSDAVRALFSEAADRFGPVEILVNNAGITRDELLLRMDPEVWDEVIAVNLRSVYLCTRAALRGMLRGRFGRVVSIGSVAGLAGNPGQANYAASKAAIVGFTRSVAKEVGSRGITVNVVAPGFIDTEMTADLAGDARERAVASVAAARFGTVDEVASAVAYLCGDEASYINGHVLVVDGGLAL